jgi:hypothetical protein
MYYVCRVRKNTKTHSLKTRQGLSLEELRTLLQPWYLQIKFIHLLMVAMWSFSTAVAYRNFIVPIFRAWQADPGNIAHIANRDEAIERFDRGAILEHVAFPIVLTSGLLMVWLAEWNWHSVNWLTLKLVVILVIFLPMEAVDYHLSHFRGNKRRIRLLGDTQRYESTVRFHWRFFRITTPLVVVFIPLLFYLAITKPL